MSTNCFAFNFIVKDSKFPLKEMRFFFMEGGMRKKKKFCYEV